MTHAAGSGATSMDPRSVYADRTQLYVKGRPVYPPEVLDPIRDLLTPGHAVADVGSGTGLLAELVLRTGATVHGVEPNPAMRAAAEERLPGPAFVSVAGTAERTTLPDASMDVVTVGQALHWFDLAAAGREFRRITRGDGRVLLVWNERRRQGTPFEEALEQLLRDVLPAYAAVADSGPDPGALVARLLGHDGFARGVTATSQLLDRDGLLGRVLSNSWSPAAGEEPYDRLVAGAGKLFQRYAREGSVLLRYDTLYFSGSFVAATSDPGPGGDGR